MPLLQTGQVTLSPVSLASSAFAEGLVEAPKTELPLPLPGDAPAKTKALEAARGCCCVRRPPPTLDDDDDGGGAVGGAAAARSP